MRLPEHLRMVKIVAGDCTIEPAPDVTIYDFINYNESEMKTIFTKERLCDFTHRAYKCACKHGFHEESRSNEHFLMLICSEIGEAMEADRKGRRVKFSYEDMSDMLRFNNFSNTFEKYVKDSIGDELGDICIRFFDLCGELETYPLTDAVDRNAVREVLEDKTFCESCYELLKICCLRGEIDYVEVSGAAGVALVFVEELCKKYKIDLLKHIEWKMKYNEQRPKKHGKQY